MPENNEIEESLEDIYSDVNNDDTDTETEESSGEELSDGTDKDEKIPYDRFQEVAEAKREAELRAEEAEAELERITQMQEEEAEPEELPQFETPEDLINYQDQKVEEKMENRLQHQEVAFEARLEAQQKINALEKEFPEVMEDPILTEMISTRLQETPDADIVTVAKELKDYLKSYEKVGEEKARENFLQKNSFQGRVNANLPLQQSDEDKEYAKKIIEQGKGTSIF